MKRPEERQYRYKAAPAEDKHGGLGEDWHNEVGMAGWSEETARRFARSFRYQGLVIRETRERAYGDSGCLSTAGTFHARHHALLDARRRKHQPAPAFVAWADRERRTRPAFRGLRDAARGAGL